MHLIRHARSRAIIPSSRVSTVIAGKSQEIKYCDRGTRAYSEVAAAENAPSKDELVLTEIVSQTHDSTAPVPDSSTPPISQQSFPKRTRLNTLRRVGESNTTNGELPELLSHKLRNLAPGAERRLSKKKKAAEERQVVEAAKEAIRRDQSSQGDILQTLQGLIQDNKSSGKGKKKKKREPKKKPAKVDTSALFEHLRQGPSIRSLPPPILPTKGEWKSEAWKEEDWGEDELTPLTAELEADSSSRAKRVRPPHQGPPLPYTRRIEGLLQPKVGQPVLEDLMSPSEHKPVAKLAHGLDRVLFNPGVHWLQDPRSGVYNFTTWLESIPSVKKFAFDRVTGFIRSSGDNDLWQLAKREKRTYAGSTSSLTGMLGHIYFLISGDRDVDTSSLSRHFQNESKSFTAGQRMPTSVNMNFKDGVYAFDSASSDLSEKNVLTWMGTMLEKFLTSPQEEFKRYLRDAPELTEDEIDPRREAYRYSKSAKFVMRSQLDCVDKRLPGTGVFDIKTRAALPIRLDMLNYEENSGYLIRTQQGPLESFEKEYYDLIRSAFLKYSLQVRIGNMDGVLVAYHNTARLFGFQYISLDEMDSCLYGGPGRGDRVFEKCVGLLEEVADEITRTFPSQSVKCTFETEESSGVMHVWVEPLDWDAEKGPPPIAQLDVHAINYLREKEVRGSRAVSETEAPWLLHWKISRSSLDNDDIRHNLSGAKDRQFRAWALPAGVSYETMAEHWNNLKFGSSSNAVEYKSSYVRAPSKNIEQLRKLSRVGRDDTQKIELENAGKNKVVWGLPEELTGTEDVRSWLADDNGENATVSLADTPVTVILAEGTEPEADYIVEDIVLDGFLQEDAEEANDLRIKIDAIEESLTSGKETPSNVSSDNSAYDHTTDNVISESTEIVAKTLDTLTKDSHHEINDSQVDRASNVDESSIDLKPSSNTTNPLELDGGDTPEGHIEKGKD